MVTRKSKVVARLDAAASVAVIVVAGLFVWTTFGPPARPSPGIQLPTDALDVRGQPRQGSAAAKVVVLEVSDFQCPYCRRFALDSHTRLIDSLVETGLVEWRFVNLPLGSIHPDAQQRAAYGRCAQEQDRFWPAYEWLFEHQSRVEPSELVVAIGLQQRTFAACLDAKNSDTAWLDIDLDLARAIGITSTPTFIVAERIDGDKLQLRHAFVGADVQEQIEAAVNEVGRE